jgi:magnesium transporter
MTDAADPKKMLEAMLLEDMPLETDGMRPQTLFPEVEEETFYGLTDDTFSAIIASARAEDWVTVEQEIGNLEPSDIASLLDKASRDDALVLVARLHETLDSEVYAYLGHERLKQLFTVLAPHDIGAIIADLDTDDAIRLIEDFDDDTRRDILRYVSVQTRALVEEGLTFPEQSAGRIMQRDVVAIPQFWTVGKALDFLQAMRDALPEQFYDLFIVDPRHRVTGQIALGRLLRATRAQKIADVASETLHTVPAQTDQEEVAALFKRVTMTSVPVIDDAERLIGVITIDDIVSVVEEETSEDLLRLGGVESSDLAQGTFVTAYGRFRWLFVNLLTAILASAVVGLFEATLEKVVALAVLMPIVAGMGGNAGTQTLTVAVRALATHELSAANYWRVTLKETVIGVLNGLAFAVIMGVVAWVWFSDMRLGGVIAGAMIVNLFMAGLAGSLIPIALDRMRIDPAISSAVFLTTVTDVVGFFAFLGLATLFLI